MWETVNHEVILVAATPAAATLFTLWHMGKVEVRLGIRAAPQRAVQEG